MNFHFPLLSLALVAAVAHGADSEVVLTNGDTIEADEIVEATCEKVVIKGSRGTQSFEVHEVARVVDGSDSRLNRALREAAKGDYTEGRGALIDAIKKGERTSRPYAEFFLGEFFEQNGKTSSAIKAYLNVAKHDARHFYAAEGLYRAHRLQLASGEKAEALKSLEDLASGKMGAFWKEKGGFALAQLELNSKPADALKTFESLSKSARSEEIKELAKCGVAQASINSGGDAKQALTRLEGVLGRTSSPAVKGYALKGVADCLAKDGKNDEAMLTYLKSMLLYPSNAQAGAAAAGAAKVSQALGLGAEGRLQQLANSPIGAPDYVGDKPDFEVLLRCMQNVSANIVLKYGPEAAKSAPAAEKADLEFLSADALRIVGSNNNDPAKLKEYEEKLKELRKKYPNHDRAQNAGVDTFLAAKDRALAKIALAEEEKDAAKRESMLKEGRALFDEVLEPMQKQIKDWSSEISRMLDKEVEIDPNDAAAQKAAADKRKELEFQRDKANLLYSEALRSYAETYDPGSKERKERLTTLIDVYGDLIDNCGIWFFRCEASLGMGQVLLALERYEDAIPTFQEVVEYGRPEWDLNHPSVDAEQREWATGLIRDFVIRGYYGWIQALNMSGNGKEAFKVISKIDENEFATGWRDHNAGILITFGASKALAGMGRGSEGAGQLFDIIKKDKADPNSPKIPSLGMSRLGAGACKALSELSDQTGGEIYTPEIQYHVGIGYFLRERRAAAISAFKGVLTAAQTRSEREEWVPKAVQEIGKLLFNQERYLEATLAYETIFSEFPDHPDAKNAVRYALSAAKQAVEQFGEDVANKDTPIAELYTRIQLKGAEVDEDAAIKVFMNDAAEQQKKGRWIEAAKAYLKVPDEKDGKPVRMKANAEANAGYCFFKAFEKSKDDKQLKQARDTLLNAGRLAKKLNDDESFALACYYLGQLENETENFKAAEAALRPFDTDLANTQRVVPARYEQVKAYLGQNELSKAEECFDRVADKTSDRYFQYIAYTLMIDVRERATKTEEVPASRALNAKAAKYAKAWFGSTDREKLKDVHYWLVSSILFTGGEFEAVVECYKELFKRFPRPALDGNKEASEANEKYDRAEARLGFALHELGRHKEALDLLLPLSQVMYAMSRNKVANLRGTFVERVRDKALNKWFISLEVDGKPERFLELSGGGTSYNGVPEAKKDDFSDTDRRDLVLTMKRDPMVVVTTAHAAWALYQKNKDPKLLADTVTSAYNELRYVMQRVVDESYWQRLCLDTRYEQTDYLMAKWEADVTYLRIKMAREEWAEVAGDIETMKQLKTFDAAPKPIQGELDEILKQAKGKQ
ncbi:MAG: hypothetical protein KDD82_20005 [Planctomycetes bacterium]|nr:hypothetical protein [Planctomycetota bacterium]